MRLLLVRLGSRIRITSQDQLFHLHVKKSKNLKFNTLLVLKSKYSTIKKRDMEEANSSSTVKISVLQMTSTSDKDANLLFILNHIDKAAQDGSKMLFVPESFDFIGRSSKESAELSEKINGPFLTALKRKAQESNIWLSLGGFHERQEELREDMLPWMKNVHLVIDNHGYLRGRYEKIHLFQFSGIGERNTIIPGDKIERPILTPVGLLALGICYDLRFPEFSQKLRSYGAQVLTYPSAFTQETGAAHWEVLLRARAIETQCFVIAPAQIGSHNEKRVSYGHSMVVDPWGKILAEASENETLITVDLPLDLISFVRSKMSVYEHKAKPEVYSPPGEIVNIDEKKTRFKIPTETLNSSEYMHFGHIQLKKCMLFLESDFAVASVNKKCVLPGHVLVIPKRVARRVSDLTPAEISDLFLLAQKVQKIMELIYKAHSSTLTIQDGPDAGQTVEHVHVHIIPRTPVDFKDNDTIYIRLAKHDKTNDHWRTEEEMVLECNNIRNFIRSNDNL